MPRGRPPKSSPCPLDQPIDYFLTPTGLAHATGSGYLANRRLSHLLDPVKTPMSAIIHADAAYTAALARDIIAVAHRASLSVSPRASAHALFSPLTATADDLAAHMDNAAAAANANIPTSRLSPRSILASEIIASPTAPLRQDPGVCPPALPCFAPPLPPKRQKLDDLVTAASPFTRKLPAAYRRSNLPAVCADQSSLFAINLLDRAAFDWLGFCAASTLAPFRPFSAPADIGAPLVGYAADKVITSCPDRRLIGDVLAHRLSVANAMIARLVDMTDSRKLVRVAFGSAAADCLQFIERARSLPITAFADHVLFDELVAIHHTAANAAATSSRLRHLATGWATARHAKAVAKVVVADEQRDLTRAISATGRPFVSPSELSDNDIVRFARGLPLERRARRDNGENGGWTNAELNALRAERRALISQPISRFTSRPVPQTPDEWIVQRHRAVAALRAALSAGHPSPRWALAVVAQFDTLKRRCPLRFASPLIPRPNINPKNGALLTAYLPDEMAQSLIWLAQHLGRLRSWTLDANGLPDAPERQRRATYGSTLLFCVQSLAISLGIDEPAPMMPLLSTACADPSEWEKHFARTYDTPAHRASRPDHIESAHRWVHGAELAYTRRASVSASIASDVLDLIALVPPRILECQIRKAGGDALFAGEWPPHIIPCNELSGLFRATMLMPRAWKTDVVAEMVRRLEPPSGIDQTSFVVAFALYSVTDAVSRAVAAVAGERCRNRALAESVADLIDRMTVAHHAAERERLARGDAIVTMSIAQSSAAISGVDDDPVTVDIESLFPHPSRAWTAADADAFRTHNKHVARPAGPIYITTAPTERPSVRAALIADTAATATTATNPATTATNPATTTATTATAANPTATTTTATTKD